MRRFVLGYLLPRIVQWAMVIFLGITVTFLIPRLSPSDPVERQIGEIIMSGAHIGPETASQLREALTELYGLEGTLWEQYVVFWGRLLRGDLGPSLSRFPTPVTALIGRAMPWTLGVMLAAVLISWILGNILGGLASYYPDSGILRLTGVLSQAVRPIPYYVMSLVMLILFAYLIPLFPFHGAYPVGARMELSFDFVVSVLKHSALPALSLVVVGIGGWFLSMQSLASNIISEDYVVYAETMGLLESKILPQYVMRNAMLPQITGLGLQLGMIFSGALIMEVVFGYPGVGSLALQAILANDYSLIIGIAIFSIIGVATSVLVLDLLYPLFDPRVRHQ